MSRRLHSVPDSVAEDLSALDAALNVPCPRCAAARDEYCHNVKIGGTLHGRVSHWQRLVAARQEDPNA